MKYKNQYFMYPSFFFKHEKFFDFYEEVAQ